VVSEKPVAGGRYIGTPDFPKLGYISNTPGYVLARLKEVSTNDVTGISIVDRQVVSTNTTAAVSITMFPEDGRSFAAFTRQNIDRQILLMLSDRPLIAPMVRAPIETGGLELPSFPKSVVDDIQRLVRHE
jgi:preprotein translocase subunit SecD